MATASSVDDTDHQQRPVESRADAQCWLQSNPSQACTPLAVLHLGAEQE